MNPTVNPEIAALRDKVENQSKELTAQAKEISEMRGNLQQLDKLVSATTRQSIWQMIALVVSLCGAIIGGLAYQTTMIDRRIEQIEKRIELSEKNMTARFEDLKQRFEDLKQEVRAKRER